MKVAPYVVLAVAAGIVVVRLGRRRRGSAAGSAAGHRNLRWSGAERSRLGDTGLVAAREVRERLRGRFFKVITLVILAVVAAAILVPKIHSSAKPSATRIGVVGPLSPSERGQIVASAKRSGVTVRLVSEGSAATARRALRDGSVGVVVEDGRTVLVETSDVVGGSTTVAQAARSAATVLGVARAFAGAGLTPAQAAAISHAKAVPVRALRAPPASVASRSTSIVGLVLVFVLLTQYLTWTLMGVLEEKTSRVVEVLLSAVRPIQLLAGKVLGIGATALLQAGIVVAFALVLARAVGSDLLHGTAPLVVVATLAWLVLGYTFYSWVYAAAGSMAANQSQVQSLALPLSLPLIVGYVVGLTSASQASPSVLITVFAYLPPFAPFAMPVLVGDGAVTWWQFALSAGLTVACTVAVARLAAAVYRRAVLQSGRRLTAREVLGALREGAAATGR